MCSDSKIVFQALEEKFPEPSLFPEDRDEFDAFMELFSKINMTLFKLAYGPMPDSEAVQELQQFLQYADDNTAKYEGPYLFGEFSAADIATAAFLPLATQVKRGLDMSSYPHLMHALNALMARPSYQQTAVDFDTRAMLANRFFNVKSELVRSLLTPMRSGPARLSCLEPV